ncbi:hypothetical protein MLD38_040890 [Melastoma candidum]|nr:hypothetical protein MLD38_040890 [Melastoma candidum]
MDAVVARSSPPLLSLSCSPNPAPPRVLSLPLRIPLPSPSFSSSYYSCSHPIASQRVHGGHVLAVPAGGGTLVMSKNNAYTPLRCSWKQDNWFPVVDDDWKLVGLVSDYDLLALDTISGGGRSENNMFPEVASTWKTFNEVQKLLSKTNGQVVGDVMTPAPVVLRESTNLEDAARILLETKYRRLPVVDANGKLVGIITRGNVVRAALQIKRESKRDGQDYIENVINASGFEASPGIEILIETCLITIDGYTIKGARQVHDLLQLTGKNIVKFPDEPESRSRLWDYEHVLDVLSNGAGTNAMKAIVVRLGHPTRIQIDAGILAKFRKLRLLIMHKVTYNGDPINFPSSLCWLEWLGYSSSTFVFSPSTAFKNMRHISLERCQRVIEIPDLSSYPNLETLDFSNCTGLVKVDNSVGYLEKLVRLSLGGCGNLLKLPDELHWRSLETLTFAGCYKLEMFPEVMVKMESFEKLRLQRTAIKELPASIVNLVSVKSIDLSFCSNFVTVPCSIYGLRNLESLDLRRCWSLEEFPLQNECSTGPAGSIGFPSLLCLKLSRCNLQGVEFLDSVNCFPKMSELFLSENEMIIKIPSLSNFENLEKLYIDGCRRLEEINGLPRHLRVLTANGCGSLGRIPLRPELYLPGYYQHQRSCLKHFEPRIWF